MLIHTSLWNVKTNFGNKPTFLIILKLFLFLHLKVSQFCSCNISNSTGFFFLVGLWSSLIAAVHCKVSKFREVILAERCTSNHCCKPISFSRYVLNSLLFLRREEGEVGRLNSAVGGCKPVWPVGCLCQQCWWNNLMKAFCLLISVMEDKYVRRNAGAGESIQL